MSQEMLDNVLRIVTAHKDGTLSTLGAILLLEHCGFTNEETKDLLDIP